MLNSFFKNLTLPKTTEFFFTTSIQTLDYLPAGPRSVTKVPLVLLDKSVHVDRDYSKLDWKTYMYKFFLSFKPKEWVKMIQNLFKNLQKISNSTKF